MDTSIVDEASSPPSILYDVFLSCGQDTRRSFTNHLYLALERAAIHVFPADVTKQPEQRMKAIEDSRIAVIIFSREYAFSVGCLRELEKIMECRRTQGQMVLPIFCDVGPKDVREHIVKDWEEMMQSWRKSLIEAANLANLGVEGREEMMQSWRKLSGLGVKEREEMMQSWRESLIEAANLSSLNSTECDGYLGRFVRKIVDEITIKLEQMFGRSRRTSIVIFKHARNQ